MRNLRSFEIVEYVKQRKRCSLDELRKHFGVSSATIHRDASALVARGALMRLRGGLAALETPAAEEAGLASGSWRDRMDAGRAAKARIAEKAARFLVEGDILFLDSSTTVGTLADILPKVQVRALTIVTNSVSVIERFSSFPPHWVLIGLGGPYDARLHAFLGQETFRQLERLTLTKAFVSAYGLDDHSATTNHENQAVLLSRVLERTPRKFLLVDRSKFGRSGLYRLAARGAFDEVVTD